MEIRKYKITLFLTFIFLGFFLSCKNKPIECKTVKISIENRWSQENNGIDYLTIEDKKDIEFICKRINQFSEGKEVVISYSYGDIDIYLNSQKIQAIFTYRNGVVYRVSPGKYVYDEALTKRILKVMKIKKRCWGDDCSGNVSD